MNGIERYLDPLRWFAALVLAAFVAGCGGGSGDGGGSGTLGVSLTDAPACGFNAVNVSVSKVRAHLSGDATEDSGGWAEITLSPARKINLVDLTNGVVETLGETTLPAGHYTQLRLMLVANTGSSPTNNSVVLSGAPGTEIALTTPSAVQSGIKLINEFDVAPGQRVDLVLDFDACKSVVRRGNGTYLLKPVIKVIPTVLNGINGFVDTSLSNVMVSAQVGGTVVRSTVPNTSTGAFLLARLVPGDYDVVITADNHDTAIIGTVPVASSSIVMVSNATAPISLPPSTMSPRSISGKVSLNPASATDEVIFVAAKHISGPQQVTVKSQAANLDTGAYTLTLPVGAPLYGQYGSGTLPISLEKQDALAGKYTVEASATGYLTQSFSWDMSMPDTIPDFTLTP
jgi:hypothetical protein